jgi:hypothetical protein
MFRPRMRFGKYEGWSLDEIPSGYLKWLLREVHNLDGWTRRQAQEVFRERGDDGSFRGYYSAPQPEPAPPPSVARLSATERLATVVVSLLKMPPPGMTLSQQ